MKRVYWTAVILGLWCAYQATAQESAGVEGSSVRFPTTMELAVGDATVRLRLTGTALRKKLMFNVYAIASYVDADARIRSAEELAACDRVKILHLVMERDVSGRDMADAFVAAVRNNYDDPRFADSLNRLTGFFRERSANKGDHILFVHVPGRGLECSLSGKGSIRIEEAEFSQAVWDIYFGKNNLGATIKNGLVSRL